MMMSPFNLTIKPIGIGTVTVELQFAKKKVSFAYTLICDPLGDLAKSLIRIENGKSHFEEILFSNEPGDVKLSISKIDRQNLRISIFQNKDTVYGGIPQPISNDNSKPEQIEIVPINIAQFKHLLSFDIPQQQFLASFITAIEAFQINLMDRSKWNNQSALFTRALKVNFNKLKG